MLISGCRMVVWTNDLQDITVPSGCIG